MEKKQYIDETSDDDKLTNALIALENRNFFDALKFAADLLNYSEWFEIRAAAIGIYKIASNGINPACSYDAAKQAKEFLSLVYDTDDRNKHYTFSVELKESE